MMQALELLLNRSSQARLETPAPAGEALQNILKAGLRTPDHACLSPWRFIVCQGNGLNRLGQMLKQAAIDSAMSERDIQRAPELPLRAPMVVIAITEYKEHEKVPWVEQVASASCALHAMQLAALAQGFGGMWRTGSYARNDCLKRQLELTKQDEIVGFLYLGTTPNHPTPKPAKEINDFVEFWD